MVRKTCIAIVVLLSVALLLGVSYRCWVWLSAPWQVKKFVWNRDVFERYASEVKAGAIGTRADGRGYETTRELSSVGIDYIYTEGSCVIFSFANLPPDAIQEIVYSPEGSKGLPSKFTTDSPHVVSCFQIAPAWFYVVRD